MSFKDWLKKLFPVRIGYSSGPAFDPRDQERTDPLKDIADSKEKKQTLHHPRKSAGEWSDQPHRSRALLPES